MNVHPVIIVPTYNEAENIGIVISAIQAHMPAAHVLVVDDGSPDGTGAIVDELSNQNEAIHILHRTEKSGLGRAYIAGFRWALARAIRIFLKWMRT